MVRHCLGYAYTSILPTSVLYYLGCGHVVRRKGRAYDALESLRDKTSFCLLMHGESLMPLLDSAEKGTLGAISPNTIFSVMWQVFLDRKSVV